MRLRVQIVPWVPLKVAYVDHSPVTLERSSIHFRDNRVLPIALSKIRKGHPTHLRLRREMKRLIKKLPSLLPNLKTIDEAHE